MKTSETLENLNSAMITTSEIQELTFFFLNMLYLYMENRYTYFSLSFLKYLKVSYRHHDTSSLHVSARIS